MKKIMKWLFSPVDGGKINWYVNGFSILAIIAVILSLLAK